jgi:transcriptional regulator with XRE-family HTH domain
MTTGEKLTNLRKKANFTQEELADKLNVSRQAVSKWEQNQAFPETDKLIQLSKLYGVSMDYILGINNDKGVLLDDSNKLPLYQTKSFFTSIWSIIYGLIMLLLFMAPYVSLSSEGFGSIEFYVNVNVYQIIFTGDLHIGNILLIMAFLLVILQIFIGVLILFLNNKAELVGYRKIASVVELGLWTILLILFIGDAKVAMLFILLLSLINFIGLFKVKQNKIEYIVE